MQHQHKQSGFTAVELLVTLFVAAAFLIAGYQLFHLVIKDGGQTRAESRAANVAYDYLRKFSASSTTIPCSASTPRNNVPVTVDGLVNATLTITITCPPGAPTSLSKVESSLTFNAPPQVIKYATYTSSAGSSTTSDVTSGLVAWWKLNGNANTEVGSPNGVITNATPTTHNGIANTAYAFNGTNASIIANSTYGLAATNTTMTTWIYNPTAANSGSFVKVGTTTGYGIGIGNTTMDDQGTKLIIIYEGIRWIPTTANVGTGWHHIAMVIDGAGVPTAYIDGVTVGTYNGQGPYVPAGNGTYIGGGSRWFKGSVDDTRLYNRALSPSEVFTVYAGGAK